MAEQIAEYNRQVIVRLPRPVDNPEPSKYYARWNGGYVEARICAILAILAPVAKGSDAITQQLRWLYTALLLINHVSPQVTDMLIAQWICPADLRGEPCKHDKLAGCQKIRLCRMLEKYTTYTCFYAPTCPHIHSEIDISCRYVARSSETHTISCRQVLEKNRQCPAGHDFEEARRAAWAAYLAHQYEARALAAGRWVQPRYL